MADVLISGTSLVSVLGTYPIGMLRTELLSRKEERLFEGWRVFKVVHLKEKTLFGHEFVAVYVRHGNKFYVLRIERRPSTRKVASSSDMWTDDSISPLTPNLDYRRYYHLSTTFCSEAKPLTILGLCDVCAYVRRAAPIYSVTKHKHCYWFCAAFLVQLSALGYTDPSSLVKGRDYARRGCFRGTRLVTDESAGKDLATGAAAQPRNRPSPSLYQLNPFRKHSHSPRQHWMLERELGGHTGPVKSVCFTPDGKHILSGSYDQTIRTWDVDTGKDARRALTGHGKSVESVAVSPDGRHFASTSGDTVHIWDLEAGTAASEPLRGHDDWVSSTVFSPDGNKIVSGSWDNSLQLWDAETGAAIGEPLLGHTGEVSSVAWSPDGSHIVSGSDDRTIRVWDAKTGALIGEPLMGDTGDVTCVSFSPDGRYIVSGSSSYTVRLWDVAGRRIVGKPLRGHTGWVSSVAFSPNGHWIVSGSNDKTVRIWESSNPGETISLDAGSPVRSVAWSPTGERIVAGCWDGIVRVWSTTAVKRKPLHQTFRTFLSRIRTSSMQWISMELNRNMSDPVTALCFTPDGKYLLSGGGDTKIWRWNVTSRKEARPELPALEGHTQTVISLAVSLDGHRVVSTSADRTVRIWDLDACTAVTEPLRRHRHAHYVQSIAFSPDGSKIVSGSADKSLRIWDTVMGVAIGEPLLGHTLPVRSVAWSPDGRHIISGSDDKTIRVWDAQTGALLGEPLLGHTGEVYSVCFSPDGSHFVSGSKDGTVRLWETARRRPVGEPLRGHKHWVKSVAFSPDGRWIASGSRDETVRIWRSDSGGADGEVVRLHAPAEVQSVAWSPTGDVIAAGCGATFIGKVLLWRRTDV